jgi:hypothetical protein
MTTQLKTEHVTLRMDAAMRAAIAAEAERERRPVAHLLRNVLEDFVASRRAKAVTIGEKR